MGSDGRRAKQAAFSPVWRRLWQRLLSAATAGYAALLVVATHYPKPEQFLGRNPPSDKLLHFAAYAALGMLTAAVLRTRGWWSWRAVMALVAALALFAAVDEATQPLFLRVAEPLDWLFDLLGIAVGIGLVWLTSSVWGRGTRRD